MEGALGMTSEAVGHPEHATCVLRHTGFSLHLLNSGSQDAPETAEGAP